MFFQKDEPSIHITVRMCVTSFDNNGKISKREVCVELGAVELPDTRIAHCNQLHDRDLVLGKKCEIAFDVLSLEHKSRMELGAFMELP